MRRAQRAQRPAALRQDRRTRPQAAATGDIPRHATPFPRSRFLSLAATFLAVFTAGKAFASLPFANEPATHPAAGFAGNAVRIYVEEMTENV
jgi:hypothetical protein